MKLSEAKNLGLEFYNTGKPCKHGHFADRKVADGHCTLCVRIRKRAAIPYDRRLRRKNPITYLLYGAKHRAKIYNVPFDISISDLEIPKYCPILGVEMKLKEYNYDTQKAIRSSGHPTSPSIDRIDPTKGYVKGNVQIISWHANKLKSNATLEEIRLIYLHMLEQSRDRDGEF